MAKVFISLICVWVIACGVETCFLPSSLYVPVPETIPVGYQVTKVHAAACDDNSVQFRVQDTRFRIDSDGTVVALAPVSMATGGRTFSVWVQDKNGAESEMEVHLVRRAGQGILKRIKRRWSPPPLHMLENVQGPFPYELEKIVSDSAAKFDVYYTISGPGVDKHPTGLFSIERNTGRLSVHRAVDREEFPHFEVLVRVFDRLTNRETDIPLNFTILVDDVNDNAPQFQELLKFTVPESFAGQVVGKVLATDRDDPCTDHVRIKYTLLSETNLFSIDGETGVITTNNANLDREVKDKYLVIVKIQDKLGAPNGLSNTATATITLSDINDNPPTFRETSYKATVEENQIEKLILRIPVDDKDQINTPNWISKFVITKGNETGNFRIDTDPSTNEGLLYVVKPLDFEQSPKINLEISARNEAELNGTSATWASIPVEVTVTNVDEGPEFTAPIVYFKVKENTPNGTLIGTYKAIDPETKSSNGIKYYKDKDPASWVTIDRANGDIKVANTIDRESNFVKNGLYNVTVKATDGSKTGTGTVVIQVEDVNDNKPQVGPGELVICEEDGASGSVIVAAEDKDQHPNAFDFTFALAEEDEDKWSLEYLNGTARLLKQKTALPRGLYEVPITINDLQGFGGVQTVTVRICQCRGGVCLAQQNSVTLGPYGILTLLLPLALLLLLFLLLAFFCSTKMGGMTIDEGDSGGTLLKSNTEAPGDEVDASLIKVPPFGNEQTVKGSVKGSMVDAGWLGNKSMSTIGVQGTHETDMYKSGITTSNMHDYYSSQYGNQLNMQGNQFVGGGMGVDSKYLTQDSSALKTWQTNGRCLNQKLGYMATAGDGRYADDIVHAYGYEGAGSAAGSVGCCSDYDDNENLDFLNTLGPKFRNLADVCKKT
ncbi:desmocollin 2 like isoform X2 [Mugil cephalus]|uniref:desmocollin 2 like isoform X2 n=1 Tax=Mugil cephalus TaxID=48193 RepID=UPI001FB72EC7|nr:desmocollin 2 like isoform X2 [Mugil cephalus]